MKKLAYILSLCFCLLLIAGVPQYAFADGITSKGGVSFYDEQKPKSPPVKEKPKSNQTVKQEPKETTSKKTNLPSTSEGLMDSKTLFIGLLMMTIGGIIYWKKDDKMIEK